jgi:hypothetical protein
MKVAHRDWRVIAHYRDLPELTSRRELRQALLLQMTPAELSAYQRRLVALWTITLAVAGTAWLLLPSPGVWWFLFCLWILHSLRYWRIDPITVAMQEYNRDLEAVVRRDCEAARQERIDAGL